MAGSNELSGAWSGFQGRVLNCSIGGRSAAFVFQPPFQLACIQMRQIHLTRRRKQLWQARKPISKK